MEELLSVAKMLNSLHRAENGADMEQMRMHKMMYLAQRESLMYSKEPLFEARFIGEMCGPVLAEIQNEYDNGSMFRSAPDDLSSDAQELIKSVYLRYSKLSSWQLSTLSCGEFSWKNSRKDLDADAPGLRTLKLSDMRLDAARELLRRGNSHR